MTDYPGEEFPPAVDPDVEPQPDENPEPDYDTEPARESSPPYDARPGGWIKNPEPAGVVEAEAEVEAEYGERDGEAAHPLVEETMGRLDELRERPVAEHAEVYADLHERLQTALVEADAEPGDRG